MRQLQQCRSSELPQLTYSFFLELLSSPSRTDGFGLQDPNITNGPSERSGWSFGSGVAPAAAACLRISSLEIIFGFMLVAPGDDDRVAEDVLLPLWTTFLGLLSFMVTSLNAPIWSASETLGRRPRRFSNIYIPPCKLSIKSAVPSVLGNKKTRPAIIAKRVMGLLCSRFSC